MLVEGILISFECCYSDLFILVFVIVLPVCLYVYHICAYCLWGQKRTLDPQELGLQMVVNHCMGAGNSTLVLCKSYKCSTAEPSLQPHYGFVCVCVSFLKYNYIIPPQSLQPLQCISLVLSQIHGLFSLLIITYIPEILICV